MQIVPAYWAYVDRDNDGKWETLRVKRGGKWSKKLTIFEVRKQQKLAKAGGYGFRSKRIPAITPKPPAASPPKMPAPLVVAVGELGTKESPPNSNVVKYSKWYGITGPWCAMFVSWVAWKSDIEFHYAYVPYVVADARAKRNGLRVTSDPQPGDIVCYDWDGGVADHIGIFEKWHADGTFSAIEGNTSLSNNSNGGEVMRRKRYRNQVEAFVTSDAWRAA